MNLESISSPRGSGALAGSQDVFSQVRSKSASILRWAADGSEGSAGAGATLSGPIGTSCSDGDALMVSSRSRSRSPICNMIER